MLDPQVQIRIIDLATKWMEETKGLQPSLPNRHKPLKEKPKPLTKHTRLYSKQSSLSNLVNLPNLK